MSRTRVYRDGVLEQENFEPAQVSDFLAEGDTVVWLDLCTDQGDELALISEELKIDPHALEDAVNRRQRPKVDRYADHLFLTVYAARVGDAPEELDLLEVSVFVTDRAVVTVHDAAFDPQDLLARWDTAPETVANGVGGLLHGLLDLVVDSHFTAVQQLDDEVEDVEDVLFGEQHDRHLQRRMFALRKALVRLRRVVLPMREVLNTLLRRDLHLVGSDLSANYQDVYDHTLRAAEWSESLRDMITTIFETNLSMQDHRLNTVMKKLAGWAAIISVPTAVTGYFGQNVPYPGFGKAWGFWASVAVMGAIGTTLYGVFRKRDWI
ncbi:MAG TPA: magnesium transporter CorA family protein [Oryzihumus sp.]|nr:magnesium transporter CorA family protein [Oryzihumus sp.]